MPSRHKRWMFDIQWAFVHNPFQPRTPRYGVELGR